MSALVLRRSVQLSPPKKWTSSISRNISSRFLSSYSAAGDTGDENGSRYNARRNSMFTPTMLLVGTVPIFCLTLGVWQVQRLKWKIGLIDDLQEKLEQTPLVLPPQVNIASLPEYVYRKVILEGTWDHAHSMLVGPRVRDGTHGLHLITPLVRTDGSTVLVDRGFVTKDMGPTSMSLPVTGKVRVAGMVRLSQSRNAFTPDNNPEKGEWYWTDVDTMVEYAGGEKANVQPVFIEAIFEGHSGEASAMIARGMPVGRAPTVDLSNSHLSYAVTWFSLSAFTALGYARLLFRHGRSGARRMPRR